MSLPHDDILSPLPGDGKGQNLRYDPVYDKIKEARQEEEDDSNQGDWQRTRKKADVAAVIKLASSALANRSKDLQLAVWLAEALVRKDGFAALADCFNLLRELQVRFWASLYPELDDGNPEFRATSQEWFAGRCDYLLRRIPLTKKGLDWFKYYEAHDTNRERSAMTGKASEEQKREARDQAVAARETAAEQFNESFEATPKSFYVSAFDHLEKAQEALAALEAFCDERYGKVAPNFAKLKAVLEEVRQAVSELLNKKREKEPDPVPQAEVTPQAAAIAATEEAASATGGVTVKKTQPGPSLVQGHTGNREEAYAAVARAAAYLRQLDASTVAPYLLVRSLRWAELRTAGSLDPSLLVAPPTEIRQNLKRLLADNNWDELLSATETAAILPCGGAWLDLHRYAWKALSERGYSAAAKAICSELRALIADFPSLPDSELNDATPVANPDTKSWLQEQVLPRQTAPTASYIPVRHEEHIESNSGANGAADPLEAALDLARNQQIPEAMELLTRHPLSEVSGREKFLRQLKISHLCIATGQFAIAYPILCNLFAEIEGRKLLEWEGTNFIVQPLSMLVQCIDNTSQDKDQRAQVYNLLCRLEPAEALRLQSS